MDSSSKAFKNVQPGELQIGWSMILPVSCFSCYSVAWTSNREYAQSVGFRAAVPQQSMNVLPGDNRCPETTCWGLQTACWRVLVWNMLH